MRKTKIKWALEKALKPYYTSGFTSTADKVRRAFWNEMNKLYDRDNRKQFKKVSIHQTLQRSTLSGQLQQHVVMESVCDWWLHNIQVDADGRCHRCEGTEKIEQTAP